MFFVLKNLVLITVHTTQIKKMPEGFMSVAVISLKVPSNEQYMHLWNHIAGLQGGLASQPSKALSSVKLKFNPNILLPYLDSLFTYSCNISCRSTDPTLSLSLSLRCNVSQTTLDNRHLCLHCWMLAVCQLGTSGQNTNMTLQTSPTVISLVCLLHNSCYNIWQKKEEEAKSSDNRGQSYFTTRLVVGYVGKQLPSSNISIWRC